MKQVEFRVWDKKDKSMHIVISLHHPNYLDCCEYALGQSSGDVRSVQYKDCVIMQFTGLLDKNKKPIFEGDICKIKLKGRKDTIFVVKWDKARAGFNNLLMFKCEVIGNIFENPELLKERIGIGDNKNEKN